jgi:hypothetical protein
MSEEPRLSYDATSQGQRIDFAAERPRILTIAFAVFWLAGYSFWC